MPLFRSVRQCRPVFHRCGRCGWCNSICWSAMRKSTCCLSQSAFVRHQCVKKKGCSSLSGYRLLHRSGKRWLRGLEEKHAEQVRPSTRLSAHERPKRFAPRPPHFIYLLSIKPGRRKDKRTAKDRTQEPLSREAASGTRLLRMPLFREKEPGLREKRPLHGGFSPTFPSLSG